MSFGRHSVIPGETKNWTIVLNPELGHDLLLGQGVDHCQVPAKNYQWKAVGEVEECHVKSKQLVTER